MIFQMLNDFTKFCSFQGFNLLPKIVNLNGLDLGSLMKAIDVPNMVEFGSSWFQ